MLDRLPGGPAALLPLLFVTCALAAIVARALWLRSTARKLAELRAAWAKPIERKRSVSAALGGASCA